MDLTWVSATAIVKARDGSSIADWDESSGIPADHYLADPDRIKAAMRAVEDAGLTAGPVGDCTVSFSGTADQVSALFGTALDTTRPDSPAWAGGDDVLTLPTSQSLAPQLESIRLARVASHLGGRTYGAEYLPSSNVLDTDLLVGEVGQTLRASAPPRLKSRDAFPTSTVDQATRDSITQWKEGRPARSHPLPGPGGTFLGWNTGERRRTRLGVLEISGGSTVVQGLLTEFGLTPEVSSELTSGSRFEDLSVYYEYPDLWKEYVSSMARRVIELGDRLEDAKRHAVAVRDSLEAAKRPAVAVRDNPSSPLAGNAISKLVEALDGIRTNIDSLKESGGVYLKSGMKDPALDFGALETGAIEVAAKAFRALKPTDAGAADSVKHLFTSGEFPLTCVSPRTVRGVGLLSVRMQADRSQAEMAIEHHAQMVAVAAASVIAGGRVPMAFRSASNTANSLWSADRGSLWGAPADDNLVLSASFGGTLSEPTDWSKLIQHLRTDFEPRYGDPRTLFVIAVGNNGKDRPSTNFAYAGLSNVILVGGCEPQRGGAQWRASDATHGYTFTTTGAASGPFPMSARRRRV